MKTVEEVPSTPLVKYSVTDAHLAALREKFDGLTCDTPLEYEDSRLANAVAREPWVGVENRRVELKADALAYGRLVDSEAKRITESLRAIEDPLKAMKQAVDDEKERVKREAQEARNREIEAKVRAEREAEDARLKAIRDAEELRLAEERKVL